MKVAGVVGAGLMGRGIAGVLGLHGVEVRLFDVDDAVVRDAVDGLSGIPVRAVSSLDDLARGADLVIEAVAENLALKQSVFAELDAADPDAVLATNTSVLPVTRIAERTKRPERVVGMHWWNPPDLIPVVEVVRGEMTSEAVMDTSITWLTTLGKLAVRVDKDVPGFVGNRLQHALWREAISIIRDGTVCRDRRPGRSEHDRSSPGPDGADPERRLRRAGHDPGDPRRRPASDQPRSECVSVVARARRRRASRCEDRLWLPPVEPW